MLPWQVCRTSAVCSNRQLEDWLAASPRDAAAMNPREPISFWLMSLMNTEGVDNEHWYIDAYNKWSTDPFMHPSMTTWIRSPGCRSQRDGEILNTASPVLPVDFCKYDTRTAGGTHCMAYVSTSLTVHYDKDQLLLLLLLLPPLPVYYYQSNNYSPQSTMTMTGDRRPTTHYPISTTHYSLLLLLLLPLLLLLLNGVFSRWIQVSQSPLWSTCSGIEPLGIVEWVFIGRTSFLPVNPQCQSTTTTVTTTTTLKQKNSE